MFASRFSKKYLCLAVITELLALFLASVNCFQIEGSFVDAAFFFRKSLLCISHNSSLVIQGDRLFLTLFVLNGACLSITPFNGHFQNSHIFFGLLCVVTWFQSMMRRSCKKFSFIEILELLDFHSLMHIGVKMSNFACKINTRVITYANISNT